MDVKRKILVNDQIVELYLLRDRSALKETVRKYGKRLCTLPFGIIQNQQTSEECENDTYLEVWNTISAHEPRSYLYAFLACITRHISLNCCCGKDRPKRNTFVCELNAELEQCIPAPNDTECQIDNMILQEAINGFLKTLDGEKRNVFLRRYWYMGSVSTISKCYAFSQRKVKPCFSDAGTSLGNIW